MKKIYLLTYIIFIFLLSTSLIFAQDSQAATTVEGKKTPPKKSAKIRAPKKSSRANEIEMLKNETVRDNVFSPINPDSLNDQAISVARSGNYQEAISVFLQASQIREEQSALLFNNLGYAYELAGEKKKAIEAYRAAVTRDANLVLPAQNLGKLLYQEGDFSEAIKEGERVLMLDPQNLAVEAWLPDAYRMATERKILQLRQEKANRADNLPQPLDSDGVTDDDFSNNLRFAFTLGFHYNSSEKKATFHEQKSILHIPASFHLNLLLWKKFKIGITVETPYSGALNSPFLTFKQTTQLMYLSPKGFFVGGGIAYLVGDLNGAKIPGMGTAFLKNNASAVTDIKFALLIGTLFEGGKLDIGLYPRYFIADPKTKDIQTTAYDYVDFYLKFKTSLAPKKKDKYIHHVNLIFNMLHNEEYLTEYNVNSGGNLSHFLGLTSFQLGFEFGNLSKSYRLSAFFGFYVSGNLYFINLSNPEVVSLGRGQGFFGLDFGSSNMFSGYRTFSETFALFSRQELKRLYFFKEEIAFEIFSPGAPYGFSMLFRVDVGFRF